MVRTLPAAACGCGASSQVAPSTKRRVVNHTVTSAAATHAAPSTTPPRPPPTPSPGLHSLPCPTLFEVARELVNKHDVYMLSLSVFSVVCFLLCCDKVLKSHIPEWRLTMHQTPPSATQCYPVLSECYPGIANNGQCLARPSDTKLLLSYS